MKTSLYILLFFISNSCLQINNNEKKSAHKEFKDLVSDERLVQYFNLEEDLKNIIWEQTQSETNVGVKLVMLNTINNMDNLKSAYYNLGFTTDEVNRIQSRKFELISNIKSEYAIEKNTEAINTIKEISDAEFKINGVKLFKANIESPNESIYNLQICNNRLMEDLSFLQQKEKLNFFMNLTTSTLDELTFHKKMLAEFIQTTTELKKVRMQFYRCLEDRKNKK